MADQRRHLVAVLKSVWDNGLSLLPAQKLILCGSIASFMVENVIKSSALYGRVLMEIEVRPFKLADTQEMLAGRGVDEILQAQLLTGGIPQYLRLLSAAPSIQLGLQALAFQQDGYLVRDYERILRATLAGTRTSSQSCALWLKGPWGSCGRIWPLARGFLWAGS